MAVGVVDELEVVDVDDGYAEIAFVPVGACDLAIEDGVDGAVVEETGERIGLAEQSHLVERGETDADDDSGFHAPGRGKRRGLRRWQGYDDTHI